MIITNRILAKSTGFTHPQIKRWAVAFLEPDEASGQHSGIPREYSFEQAVRIFLGGYLVRDLKFNLIEARQILNDVTKWLKEKKWTISKWVNFRGSKLDRGYVAEFDFPWMDLSIDIGISGDGGIFYNAKKIFELKIIKEPNTWQEKYELEYFGRRAAISAAPFRTLNIRAMISSLAVSIAQRDSE
jgi:hypothetical protein